MLSRRFEIAPHRAGGNERGDHPESRIERLGRGMGARNGTLEMPGDRCRINCGRFEHASDVGTRVETR